MNTSVSGRKERGLLAKDKENILAKLSLLFGENKKRSVFANLKKISEDFLSKKQKWLAERDSNFNPLNRFSHNDSAVITYGDFIREDNRMPLETLTNFLTKTKLKEAVNIVHILPPFTYSSDRGFSIIDYEQIDQKLGNWNHITKLSRNFRLMNDLVLNHVSSKSKWFTQFLDGHQSYKKYFISFSRHDEISGEYLSRIRRPRTSPLLSEFTTKTGKEYLWTTFSGDQIDLNYKNPEVFLEVVRILLSYVNKGASIIRLDAITYLWKELGTECANLRQNYAVVNLFRTIMENIAPSVSLITETNVPHAENISYFGNREERGAHMVYNFALPPLVLHTMQTGNANRLVKWASGLKRPFPDSFYFNFLDSHDGIGINPAYGILDKIEIDNMLAKAVKHGGRISYKTGSGGNQIPYEINITWFSALNSEDANESEELRVRKFIASRSIALSLGSGIPAAYLPSFFGTRNDYENLRKTGCNRDINRPAIRKEQLEKVLEDSRSTESMVFSSYTNLLARTRAEKAFHPAGESEIIKYDDNIFIVLRTSPEHKDKMLCLTNITNRYQKIKPDFNKPEFKSGKLYDIITGREYDTTVSLKLEPYQTSYLKPLTTAH